MDAHPYYAWLVANTYVVILVATAIDATGFPFPGRLLLVAAGAVAATGGVYLPFVVLAGVIGAVLVDHLWYFAGSLGTGRIFALLRRLTARSARDARRTAKYYFDRWGAAAILLGRFVAVVRIVAWPLARASGVGYARFALYDVSAAIVWTATWALLGYALHDTWRATMANVGGWTVAVGAGIAVAAGGAILLRLRRRRAAPSA